MPQAVTHILVPLILMSLIRDFLVSKKKKRLFPLHYVLIAGISGIIPDLDIAAYWILSNFGFAWDAVHKTFFHTLYVPLAFLLLGLIFSHVKVRELGRHHLKLPIIFLMMAFGSLTHLILDALLGTPFNFFYPLAISPLGFNLASHLPAALQSLFYPCLDAALVIFYLLYLEWKHKISDFI